jgi:hypothetical protein
MDPLTRPADPLDGRLRSLAEQAPWHPTLDAVGAAMARLRSIAPAHDVGPRAPRRAPMGRSWRVLLLALLALLIAAVVTAALFGLPGLRLGFTDVLPSPQVPRDASGIRAALGTPSDIQIAGAALGDDLLVPEALGQPDEVYLGRVDRQARVALVYVTQPGSPAVVDDIGLLVTEWRGAIDDRYARKWLMEERGHAELVEVDGDRGYWVSGMPHVLEYLDDVSGIRRRVTRLVGDVLVWQSGRTVYRIESPLGRDATLAIAESMR